VALIIIKLDNIYILDISYHFFGKLLCCNCLHISGPCTSGPLNGFLLSKILLFFGFGNTVGKGDIGG
jgi:hypothetical protein